MKRVVAVVLRAPLALVVIALVRSLLEAAGNVVPHGAKAAFSMPALLASAVEALPWALSLGAWYLAIVAGRRFSSRLAAHALVFACICLAAFGGLLLPRSPAPERPFLDVSPTVGHFSVFDKREIAIDRLDASRASGVTIEDARERPRLSHYETARWNPETGTLAPGTLTIELRSDSTQARAQGGPPLFAAGGGLEPWMDTPHTIPALILGAFSFALLASGVRFPVRLFRWPLPGALLGLLFAWAMPGLYAVFGSPTTHEAFLLLGLDLSQSARSTILACTVGVLMLLADLAFRAPDSITGGADA